MQEYDIAIVGAGILGAAAARELSRYELSILWLEKSLDVATGVTRGNTSIVHGGFDDAADSVKGLYAPRGAKLIETLDQQLHFGFYKCGSLVVSLNAAERLQLEALRQNGQNNGVRGLEIWGKDELHEREPHLNPEAACALYAGESGVLIGPEFCIALAENALANGAELHLGEELLNLHPAPRSKTGYVLETTRGSYRCQYMVNAAGWGALRVSQMLGSCDYELQAVKGQYLVFDRSCGHLANHVLFPLPDKLRGKGVTVCPTYHGNLLVGPDAEFVDDPRDLSTQFNNLQMIYRQGQSLLPNIPRTKIIRSYAGMRPRLKSMGGQRAKKPGDFLIRYAENHCELLAIASPGITSALPIAQELVAKIAERRQAQGAKMAEKTKFQAERRPYIYSQRDKRFIAGQALKRLTDLPLEHPDCLVCRCEQVKSAVIQEAIRRSSPNFAATTYNLNFLKWRTRATMGFCQGQFCKPRLRQLLASLMMPAKHPIGWPTKLEQNTAKPAATIVENFDRGYSRVSLKRLRREL